MNDINLVKAIENEILSPTDNVTWDSIAGLDEAKDLLFEAVVLPLTIPNYFTAMNIQPWKGVLMFGPPGTGKTMLAKAASAENSATFFSISASSFASKYVGDGEKMVKILFKMATYYSPSTIFIDEIDSIAGKRGENEHEVSRRMKTELMVQMDGANSLGERRVLVLAATNRPWDIDEALRRRLEKRVYIPLPDIEGRTALFKINMKGREMDPDVNVSELAHLTDGYSADDITKVCGDAKVMSLRRLSEENKGLSREQKLKLFKEKEQVLMHTPVSKSDFMKVLDKVKKSVDSNDLAKYAEWMNEFGSA